MKGSLGRDAIPQLYLEDKTARELMTPGPISLRENATVVEAVELLTRRGISAAPVIDAAGRPIGVLSRTDILIHDRGAVDYVRPSGEDAGDAAAGKLVRARDIMTPMVFCVSPDASAARVVRDLVELKVHRLFVVDNNGTLLGVISVLDVLRHLQS
jgi:CBS domain-containing protein